MARAALEEGYHQASVMPTRARRCALKLVPYEIVQVRVLRCAKPARTPPPAHA